MAVSNLRRAPGPSAPSRATPLQGLEESGCGTSSLLGMLGFEPVCTVRTAVLGLPTGGWLALTFAFYSACVPVCFPWSLGPYFR